MELTDQHQFKTEEEFSAIMDPFPIMVRACFATTETCYFNASWKRFAGDVDAFSQEIHEDYRLEFDRLLAAQVKLRTAFKTSYKFRDAIGIYRWLAEQLVPWYSVEGDFVGFICYTLEINELVDVVNDQISEKALQSSDIIEPMSSSIILKKYAEDLNSANSQLLRSNQELAISEAHFKFLIQEAPVAIGVLHQRDLIIESANIKLLEVWGKSSDVVGMPLSVALPELQGQPFLKILDQVYTTGQPFYANEIRAMLEHEGELKEMFFNLTYQPKADFSGATAGILVVAVDVTKQVNSRKLVEHSEQHFRSLADLVPAKISNALPSGEVTFFNKQWLEFSGMGFEDLRDFGYHRMMHPDEIADFQAGLAEAAANGVAYVSEMRFKNIEGKYIWHLNIASPIIDEDGRIMMWVGSTTDIHAMKIAEQRKSDFVSMISHEIKTPVTSIKGHVQLLLRVLEKETASALTDRIRPSLTRINQLLVQLTELIADMLDMTRIEAGRLDLRKEPLLLDVLIAVVVEDFRLSHQEHQFNLNLESGIEINADRHKIIQVLINLISNAIKYAPKSDVIDISLTTAGKEIMIRIRDYGIGIDERDQKKIFERFYRVEGQNESHYSGLGIGLFLAYSIIEFHGGKISLESSKGKGSTFIVYLPR